MNWRAFGRRARALIQRGARIFVLGVRAPIEALLRGPQALRNITVLRPLPSREVRKVAVVVTHKPSDDFKRLLSSLRRRGYQIMGYRYAADVDVFEPEDAVYARRISFGRDFAAYKHAASILAERDDVATVMFVNDSFFVSESVDEVVKWFSEYGGDWAGFTVNMREHFHVGSFLFQVKGRALAETFRFMNAYWPLDTRYHAVHWGETGLSSHLAATGFVPASYVLDSGILKRFRADAAKGVSNGETWALGLFNNMLRVSGVGAGRMTKSSDHAYNAGQIARFIETANVFSRVGYYLFDRQYIPLLKKDVFYRMTINSYPSLGSIPGTGNPESWRVVNGRARYVRSLSWLGRALEIADD